MSAVELLQPLLGGGLQRNNFFNGRLLSAEDLRAEQEAERRQQAHLARAAGDGISWGLGVKLLSAGASSPRVTVSKGVALNRLGDVLHLPSDAEVTLVPDTSVVEAAEGLFARCEPPQTTPSLTGEGAYVLVIAPSSGYSGAAIVSDPNTTESGRGSCGARFSVEGVRFRLVPMEINSLDGLNDPLRARAVGLLPPTSTEARERLRNLLAHLCFGTQPLDKYFKEPLKTAGSPPRPVWASWGALDAMRIRGDLTDCDVPLAIVVLTSAGISFVDMWPARRKLTDEAAIESWRGAAGPRRIAEGEAAFLQFQSQLEIVMTAAAPPSIAAATYFDLLPAAGWLPAGTAGFQWKTFLGKHAPPVVTPVDGALLRGILQRSWSDEPFRLDTEPPVPVRVYQVPGEQFVLFGRSLNGNVRVFLNPPPGATEKLDVVAVKKTGDLSRATTREGSIAPIPDLAPGMHTITVSGDDYVAVAPVDAEVVGGRTTDIGFTLIPLPNGKIRVKAIDKETGKSLRDNVTSIIAESAAQRRAGSRQGDGTWLIGDVPPGTYTVTGIAKGYAIATTAGVGPVVRGQELDAVLVFEPEEQRKEPSRCVAVKEARRPKLRDVRLCIILSAVEFEERYYYEDFRKSDERESEKGTGSKPSRSRFRIENRRKSRKESNPSRFTTSAGELVYQEAPWREWVRLEPESTAVRKWLLEWREWFAGELQDRKILDAEPMIFIDPRYVAPRAAGQVRKTPGGYAVFNRFAAPLAIKNEDAMTRARVPLERAGMRGLSKETLLDLCAADICDIDDLSWSWTELIGDITGDPPDTLKDLIAEAGIAVERINRERAYYPDVDNATNRAMDELGLRDDVALANADPDLLGEKLGSRSFARRLVMRAREIVPREGWSLDGLGLSDDQVEGFNDRGIDSKGVLTTRASTVDGKAVIANVLGIDTEPEAARNAAVGAIANEAVAVMARSSVAMVAETRISGWKDVDTTTGMKLTAAGFESVSDLAAADPAAVAAAANLSAAEAEKLVTSARGASRAALSVGIVAPVSAAEEAGLTAMFGGNATLAAIAGATPSNLAGAFNGDVARATAVLNGVRAGLAGRIR
jgi:hypothetical protein